MNGYSQKIIPKGYTHRPGWHCTKKPKAPHLSEKGRIWVKVELQLFSWVVKPLSQGGTWLLADKMKILEEL